MANQTRVAKLLLACLRQAQDNSNTDSLTTDVGMQSYEGDGGCTHGVGTQPSSTVHIPGSQASSVVVQYSMAPAPIRHTYAFQKRRSGPYRVNNCKSGSVHVWNSLPRPLPSYPHCTEYLENAAHPTHPHSRHSHVRPHHLRQPQLYSHSGLSQIKERDAFGAKHIQHMYNHRQVTSAPRAGRSSPYQGTQRGRLHGRRHVQRRGGMTNGLRDCCRDNSHEGPEWCVHVPTANNVAWFTAPVTGNHLKSC
jgi:hypothetical protein